MKTITFDEAVSRSRFTEHGRKLLDIVRKDPGIPLETLVRKHDPGPLPSLGEMPLPVATEGNALRNFPAGGRAVRQLCEAGCLVITQHLGVYLPKDVPESTPSGPLLDILAGRQEAPFGEVGSPSGQRDDDGRSNNREA